MGLYIEGMEKLEKGEHILSLMVYHDGTMSVIGDHRYYTGEPFKATIVSEPHGRLIDADKIRYHSGTWEKGYDWVMQSEIALMLTVIESSEVKE